MRKILSYALIVTLLYAGGCKKAEKQETESLEAAKPTTVTKKQHRKKKEAPQSASFEIYNEKNSVASILPDQYTALMTAKIKVGDDEVKAILLKDLLAKYQLQGKNVILGGAAKSVTLTWAQATTKDVYIYLNLKQSLQVHSTVPELANIDFPNKISRITVSAGTEAPAVAKPVKKRKRK